MLLQERCWEEIDSDYEGESTGSRTSCLLPDREDYYGAVDDAISRAMSSNSELFLLQIEQENGQ